MYSLLSKLFSKARQLQTRRRVFSTLSTKTRQRVLEIRKKKLTYLPEASLASLAHTCQQIQQQQIEGNILEAGCALGGSAILLALQKPITTKLRVYDVFGMIPPPSASDTPDVHDRYETIKRGESTGIGGDKYYGYEDDLYELVKGHFVDFGIDLADSNIELIKGDLLETLTLQESVAMAHIDVDWYDPVKACLERIHLRLSPGGSMILDDYFAWGGCRKATDEFLEQHGNLYSADTSYGTMKLTRIPA